MFTCVGHIAVARLLQGISPKHCASSARRTEGFWAYAFFSLSLSSGGGLRANDNGPVSCFAANVVSTPHGDEI
jgi:hypothetical protein